MTNEERDLISNFVQRVGGRPASSGGFAGSVPAVGAPNLPPVDPEADRLLADLFARFPEARYRITQLAFVQEHALAEATNQIAQLQAALQQVQQAQAAPPPQQASSPWGQPAAAQPQPAPSRGLFGGLFGGSPQPAPQPQYAPQYAQPQMAPQPQYAPGYQPGMFQRQGSGFLGSALTTAAGVAGGMMAANALTSLFSNHNSGGIGSATSFGNQSEGGFGGGFGGVAAGQDASPWAAPAVAAPAFDPYEQGGAQKDFDTSQDAGWTDAPAQQDSGWTDAPAADDSGWTDDTNN
jgi:hypothetical protein